MQILLPIFQDKKRSWGYSGMRDMLPGTISKGTRSLHALCSSAFLLRYGCGMEESPSPRVFADIRASE